MTSLGADGIVVRYTSGAQILSNLIYNAGSWTGGTNSGSPTYNNPASDRHLAGQQRQPDRPVQ